MVGAASERAALWRLCARMKACAMRRLAAASRRECAGPVPGSDSCSLSLSPHRQERRSRRGPRPSALLPPKPPGTPTDQHETH